MTEKERISQLELVTSQILKRLDRLTDAQAKHVEMSAQTSDNVSYLLEKSLITDSKLDAIIQAINDLRDGK